MRWPINESRPSPSRGAAARTASPAPKRRPASAKYLMAARLAMRHRLAYPAEFLGPLLVVCLILFVQSRIWATAFAGQSLIAGYSQVQLCWYVLWTETVYFSANGYFLAFSNEIKDGQIAYVIGRPCSVLWYTVAQRLGTGLLNLVVVGLAGGLEMTLCAGLCPVASLEQAAGFAASLLLGMLLQILCQTVLAMTAFWLEENSAIYWIWSKLLLVFGTLLPVELLPEAWHPVVWCTPFPWIMWAPGRLGTAWPGGGTALAMLGVQLVLAAGLAGLAAYMFRQASRKLSIQGG